jgi:hypothetical protein
MKSLVSVTAAMKKMWQCCLQRVKLMQKDRTMTASHGSLLVQ